MQLAAEENRVKKWQVVSFLRVVVLKFPGSRAVLSSSVGPEGDMEPKQL